MFVAQKNKYSFFLVLASVVLYLSLIFGFFYDENLNYGAYYDWVNAYLKPVNDFSKNFFQTLLNYNDYGQRHSPVYLIFLSLFLKLNFSPDLIRIIHLHLSIPLILIFYKCLVLKFNNIDKRNLQLLSLVIFLSPTFRSLAIWPDSRLPGLLFFVLTIYFFLWFQKSNKEKYIWFTSISLIISSYISPNFSFFFIYFFFFFLKKLKFQKLVLFGLFNFVLAIPMLYYIFILDINFFLSGKTPSLNSGSVSLNFNFSNKIMIISSIVFFHLIPIFMNDNFYYKFLRFFREKFIILIPSTFILIYFFDYQTSYTGGGIFFNLSHFLFGNDYLFFFVSFFSIPFFVYLSYLNIKNLYLLLILILTNIQNSIYHKYYEPFAIIMFFTLLQSLGAEKFLKKKINIFYVYLISMIYIFMRGYKIYYLI